MTVLQLEESSRKHPSRSARADQSTQVDDESTPQLESESRKSRKQPVTDQVTDVDESSLESELRRVSPFSSTPAHQWLKDLREELDGYYRIVCRFTEMEPDEVLVHLAAISARGYEIRTQLVRLSSSQVQAFRTKEIDPFLELLAFQFKCHSRRISLFQAEVELSKGGV